MTNRKLHMHFRLPPRSMTLKCDKLRFSGEQMVVVDGVTVKDASEE